MEQFDDTFYEVIIGGITIIYILCLLLLTYDKTATTVAGRTYVREVTKWLGHKRVVNIPVEYS